VNEGRITTAQRAEWLGKFNAAGADFAAVSADLGKLKKAVNTKPRRGPRRPQARGARQRRSHQRDQRGSSKDIKDNGPIRA
jgi:hypothetical protein